jgi:hypothetical protein
MVVLYGRAGRLTTKNGGFWPGQWAELTPELQMAARTLGYDAHAWDGGMRAALGCGVLEWGESVIKYPSPLNVLKDTYDHSCY